MAIITKKNHLLLLQILGAIIVWVDSAPAKNDTMKNISCTYTSDMGPALEKVFATCKELIQPANVPDFDASMEIIDKYYESVVKNDFNDKCFSKCLMDKSNMLTPVGTVDLKVVADHYKGGNMTETVRKMVMQEWTTCNSKIEKDFPGGGDEQKICRKVSALENCLFTKSKEIDLPCP